ncbi:hypothetical protein FA13DRAFT_1787872 [Coprinellus micaceus]|uniref:DASH complex subunit DAD3 n=1 Tax=Coprinellus micaceus TaxID=71717 RepID=A0A4Y7TS78_COPMI|nr:hypothetical protein FA13DRAFT_1787872 [Coprinellus micaceus]
MATASTSNPSVSSDIFSVNPYDGHPQLKPVEAEVLWEYAKLAQNLSQKTRSLNEEPDQTMLARLRVLEKKMGLVLTLFKASVWGVINDQPAPDAYYDTTNDTTIQH